MMKDGETKKTMGSWIRALSSCIVRHAPCFWCSLCSPPLDVHATDRAILFRLNVLVMFFASCQIFSGLSLLLLMFGGQLRPEQNGTSVQCVGHVNATSPGVRSILHGVANWDGLVDLDEQEFMSSWAPVAQGEENDIESGNIFFPSLWNLKFVVVFIGLVGLIILVFSSLAVKTIKEVILADAMRLYWLLVWVLPVELFFVANLFDIHSVTNTVIGAFFSAACASLSPPFSHTLPTDVFFLRSCHRRPLFCTGSSYVAQAVILLDPRADVRARVLRTARGTSHQHGRDEVQSADISAGHRGGLSAAGRRLVS